MEKDQRQQQLHDWGLEQLSLFSTQGTQNLQWSIVSGDASFRRYFRFSHGDESWILVDAPPEHENSEQFIAMAMLLKSVNVPRVLTFDLAKGFMLLSDLGDTLLLPELNEDTVDELYAKAMESIFSMQAIVAPTRIVPDYDKDLLHTEMELFREWFLGKHLQLALTDEESTMLDDTFALLSASALEQPQVLVHRDYHSRNLMLLPPQADLKVDQTITETEYEFSEISTRPLGIIDFQDAVLGAFTYDLVSLLRDCYIQWPAEKVNQWLQYFYAYSPIVSHAENMTFEQFERWFDWMGLQRHIKVAGIFCRLNYRDGKTAYLDDIPLTLAYILQESQPYPETQAFYDFMQQRVLPALAEKSGVSS